MREIPYRRTLIKKLEELFPGCVVLVNDPKHKQGIPDLTVLYGARWAMLEVKKDKAAPKRPNQPFWVSKLNGMSFAAFVFPQNEEEVLDALQRSFTTERQPRVP